jgi:3-oxoacyl-[acyl-carrier protein] reductase
VVVNDVDPEGAVATIAAIETAGGDARAEAGSGTSWEDARSFIDATVDAYGAIDALVNNAASWTSALLGRRPRRGSARVEVNLLGSMFCGVHALGRMRLAFC